MRHDKHHPSYTTFDNISQGAFVLEIGIWNLVLVCYLEFVIWNLSPRIAFFSSRKPSTVNRCHPGSISLPFDIAFFTMDITDTQGG